MKTSLLLNLLFATIVGASLADQTSPSSRTLLFVDDAQVLYRSGTYRILHPAKRHAVNPVIAQDKPWEVTISYNSVYRNPDTGKYQMWYQALVKASPETLTVCYAESDDGVRWTKPNLGLFKHEGKDTNMVLEPVDGHYGASVLIDPRDPDAARRYKMAIFRAVEENGKKALGPAVAFSPDGIHWTIHPKVPLMRGSFGRRTDPPVAGDTSFEWGVPLGISDVVNAMYDEPRGVFAMYCKTWLDSPEGKTIWKRAIVRMESKDFINWSKPQLVIAPDEFDSDGFEYRPETRKVNPNRRGIQLHGGPVFLYNDIYFSLLQKMDGEITGKMPTELAVSRDGINWLRHFRDVPFIGLDPYKNNFDSGCIWSSETPVILDDEIRFYYGGYSGLWNYGGDLLRKPSGVGLATIRRDRFAGIKPIEALGQVTTRSVDLSNVKSMTINVDATAGPVQVEVLSSTGFRIPGFSRDDATPVTGDELRQPITWKSGKTLSDLPPGKYMLRIHLERAELFAVTLNSSTSLAKGSQ
jgi:hypothetical protein